MIWLLSVLRAAFNCRRQRKQTGTATIPPSRLNSSGDAGISVAVALISHTGIQTMATINPVQFLQQVRAEVAKVVWPTRREVVLTTIMVFIMAALTATFFSLVDLAIRFGLTAIVTGV